MASLKCLLGIQEEMRSGQFDTRVWISGERMADINVEVIGIQMAFKPG